MLEAVFGQLDLAALAARLVSLDAREESHRVVARARPLC